MTQTPLFEHSKHLQMIIMNSPIGYMLVDDEGSIVIVNKKIEELFGYTSEEMAGNKIEMLIPAHFREKHIDYRTHYQQNPSPRPMGQKRDLFGQHKNGHQIPLEVSLVPIIEGGQSFTLASVVDLHYIKYCDELTRSNRDLEEFAYIASHDLQAPLRNIHSYIEILIDTIGPIKDVESKKYVNFILESVKHMQSLIQDLLQYSRITSEAPSFKEVDLNEVLKEVIGILKGEVEQSGAVITSEILPEIKANPVQMKQLFQNLLSNALKYQNLEAPPEVRITVVEEAFGWTFSIQDNGIGIDKSHFEHIFRTFKRVSPDKRIKGNGIGLPLVKKVVMKHGGKIWLDSELGVGTTFHFYIPKIN